MSIEYAGEQHPEPKLFEEINKIYVQKALRLAEAERLANSQTADYIEHLSLGDEPHLALTAAILFDIFPQIAAAREASQEAVISAQPEHDGAAFAEAVLIAAKVKQRDYIGRIGHTSVVIGPDQELADVKTAFGLA